MMDDSSIHMDICRSESQEMKDDSKQQDTSGSPYKDKYERLARGSLGDISTTQQLLLTPVINARLFYVSLL